MKRSKERIDEIIKDCTDRGINGEKYSYLEWYYNEDITEPFRQKKNDLEDFRSQSDYFFDKEKAYFFSHTCVGYSDYSGSMFARANVKYIEETYPKLNGTAYYTVYGRYGTKMIVFDARYMSESMIDEISALSNYPLFDDEILSEMEVELENETVLNEIIPIIIETIKEIQETIPEDCEYTLPESIDYIDIYREIMEFENKYPEFEPGGACYIDERIFNRDTVHSAICRLITNS
jgi:hypothetical protein